MFQNRTKERPSHGVQVPPLARFTQPSDYRNNPTRLALHRSVVRSVPGNCLRPASSTLHTLASGTANSYLLTPCPMSIWIADGVQCM